MMKKFQLIACTLIFSLVLVGCGSKPKATENQTGSLAVAAAEIEQENVETATNSEVAESENILDKANPAEVAAVVDAPKQTTPSTTLPASATQTASSTNQSSATETKQQATKFRLVESDGTVFERDTVPKRIVVFSAPTALIMDKMGIELAGITTTSRPLPPNLAKLPEAGIPRDPNIEIIKSINADLVIISTDFKAMNQAKMEQHKIPVYFIDNQKYEDTFKSIEILGKAFGKEAVANQLIKDMRDREVKILSLVKGKPAPKVLILFGTAESFTMARDITYAGNLVKLLGGKNITDDIKLSGETSGYIPMSIEQIVALNPDVILRISHGDPKETQKLYEQEFARNPIWHAVSAHQNNRVFDLPMELFFSNPVLQVVDALEYLAKIMYP